MNQQERKREVIKLATLIGYWPWGLYEQAALSTPLEGLNRSAASAAVS